MPLGKLSKEQIARGFEALEALEVALKAPTEGGQSLEELTSHFYTVIPHNFGRSRPPPISSLEHLQAKKDMLLVRVGRWAGRRGTPNRLIKGFSEGRENPEGWTAVGRLRDRGREGQTDEG